MRSLQLSLVILAFVAGSLASIENYIGDDNRSKCNETAELPPKDGEMNFRCYHRYTTILKYLQRLEKDYPNNVRVSDIGGTTYQNNTIKMIHISKDFNKNNPKIVIDAGIHAREWIAPAQGLYIINQLLENKDNKKMYENVDWLIIPVLNPDGYEYSHTYLRFYTKNRIYGKYCYGVDINSNFGFHWNETYYSQCSDWHGGPNADSEQETQALQSVLKGYENIKLYLTFQSYGNYILYPWGYTTQLPDDWKQLHALASKVEVAIASVRGTHYEVGSTMNVLIDQASGNSADWAKGVAGIDNSFTIVLPAGGSNDYDMPPAEIEGVVAEMWEGIKVYHEHVENSN